MGNGTHLKNSLMNSNEITEVIILGAWGCGAFRNPVEIVARTFLEQLRNYGFKVVEFALATADENLGDNPFFKILNF